MSMTFMQDVGFLKICERTLLLGMKARLRVPSAAPFGKLPLGCKNKKTRDEKWADGGEFGGGG